MMKYEIDFKKAKNLKIITYYSLSMKASHLIKTSNIFVEKWSVYYKSFLFISFGFLLVNLLDDIGVE